MTVAALSLIVGLQQPSLADSLKAHVQFLASDELAGRDTPSPGLDKAADYIAGKFKEVGLLGAPDSSGTGNSYFQTTEFENRRSGKGAVKNVIGVLKGSDADLSKTYIIVSAHYDHLGKREGDGDQIYNGANDNASGTAGIIESARLLKELKPKRTIVFIAFYGEEKGLVGSRFYCKNPVFPLRHTIANVNLEQIGRTDDDEGPRIGAFNLTGFDYTNLPSFLSPGAEKAGLKLVKHDQFSGPYFNASDNAAFAQAGIPCGTISVAYSFPDYHRPGDHWDKLDYANMAKVVSGIVFGVQGIADSASPVVWVEVEKTAKYIEAQKALMSGG